MSFHASVTAFHDGVIAFHASVMSFHDSVIGFHDKLSSTCKSILNKELRWKPATISANLFSASQYYREGEVAYADRKDLHAQNQRNPQTEIFRPTQLPTNCREPKNIRWCCS